MFNGYGALSLDADHLDISYRKPETWPTFTASGSIRAFAFDFGDAEAGPLVQLGLITKVEGEDLDWRHSVDPVHHHGSDQFRVISGGNWELAGRPMSAGGFAFQEAGWIYQEHPGPEHSTWMVLMMADRRGNKPTLKMAKDRETIIQAGDQFQAGELFEATQEGEVYPHPAGHKGIAAIATSVGPCERGYLVGRFDEMATGALTGVLGDEMAGPVVHLLRAAGGETVAPAMTYPTELLLVVSGGSCKVGHDHYQVGDMRVQRADAAMGPVVAGPDGVELSLVVADRRAEPALANAADQLPAWIGETEQVVRDLSPRPGGVRRAA